MAEKTLNACIIQTISFSGHARYDELLDVDETIMSHEILFASGASCRIEFENQMISLVKKG